MPLAASPHRCALDALRRAGDGEAVVYVAGTYFVVTAGEADDLAAAGVPFARVAALRGRDGERAVTVPAGDDG